MLLIVIRRIFFHPLSGFPGPRLAALTSFYKTYYEVLKGGELLQKIHELHAAHGPIIRIAPNELHFSDHKAYSKIYGVGSCFTKDPRFYNCFGAGDSAFGAIDPQVSKARRGTLNPFFSRRATLRLEDLIQIKVDKMIHRICERSNGPSNLFLAFRSGTLDIITTYLFGHCVDALDHPDFSSSLLLDIQLALPFLWFLKAFHWAVPIVSIIPAWSGSRLHAQYQAIVGIRAFIIAWLHRTREEAESVDGLPDFTICHSLMDPSFFRRHQISSSQSLLDEALSLLQAGSDTVGNTCTLGTFYILNDKIVHSKLVEELRSIWPDPDECIDLAVLQTLPYLTAVIKEALRLSHGFVTPLPRVVGPLGALIAGSPIPPNTIVGMSVTCVHLDSTLFPDPAIFSPERWLQPSSRELDRYLLSFSKGPRMCLGIHIAWAELYLILGYVFRKMEMEIVDTSLDDFCKFKDYFVPVYQGRQLHVRAKRASE
ncbi:cytochrome P450 [Crassisporium funariophilum]|nr:cytochrome P450 [Crassisporium funariophilum]